MNNTIRILIIGLCLHNTTTKCMENSDRSTIQKPNPKDSLLALFERQKVLPGGKADIIEWAKATQNKTPKASPRYAALQEIIDEHSSKFDESPQSTTPKQSIPIIQSTAEVIPSIPTPVSLEKQPTSDSEVAKLKTNYLESMLAENEDPLTAAQNKIKYENSSTPEYQALQEIIDEHSQQPVTTTITATQHTTLAETPRDSQPETYLLLPSVDNPENKTIQFTKKEIESIVVIHDMINDIKKYGTIPSPIKIEHVSFQQLNMIQQLIQLLQQNPTKTTEDKLKKYPLKDLCIASAAIDYLHIKDLPQKVGEIIYKKIKTLDDIKEILQIKTLNQELIESIIEQFTSNDQNWATSNIALLKYANITFLGADTSFWSIDNYEEIVRKYNLKNGWKFSMLLDADEDLPFRLLLSSGESIDNQVIKFYRKSLLNRFGSFFTAVTTNSAHFYNLTEFKVYIQLICYPLLLGSEYYYDYEVKLLPDSLNLDSYFKKILYLMAMNIMWENNQTLEDVHRIFLPKESILPTIPQTKSTLTWFQQKITSLQSRTTRYLYSTFFKNWLAMEPRRLQQ